jgi:S-adenosylmethionine hydrolase
MPIITLTTDIGQQDYIVGAIKGQLLSADASFNINDITHYLSQSNYPQAAYVCSNAFKYFPRDTFHIIILNLFEKQPNDILVARYQDQYIICPDNGILTMIAGKIPEHIIALDIRYLQTLLEFTALISDTIRKIAGGTPLEEVGTPIRSITEKFPLRALINTNWIEGQILFIDQFENVVINITKQEFEKERKGRNFKILFTRNEVIEVISNNYTSVNEGEKLAYFNSAGYLEIAINKGNFAGLFGLKGYTEKMQQQNASTQNRWFYQTVRIYFE